LNYVVDASVALKWFLPEGDNASADDVLNAFLNGKIGLNAPDLLLIVAASALWRRSVVRGELASSEAKAIYRDMLTLPVNFQSMDRLAAASFALAITHRHSAYDAVYCALAIEMDCELITSDATPVAKLGKVFPFIRHLSTVRI
jgi:predicted nucleic acid-binding protein